MLAGRRILLIIGGGIAAYKSLELIRLIQKAGARVVPVLTAGGAQFVTPLSVSALAGDAVHDQLFDLSRDRGEKTDVATEHPEMLHRLRERLDKLIADGRTRPTK